jgi:hypothetical protein
MLTMLLQGKLVNNRSLGGGVPAQQFDVRLGKDTTVPVTLGFTKSNELFVGRLAMLGVFLSGQQHACSLPIQCLKIAKGHQARLYVVVRHVCNKH